MKRRIISGTVLTVNCFLVFAATPQDGPFKAHGAALWTGYPHGLKGEKIPVEGRILNIADQYDALRSKRPYKPPLDHKEVFNIITKGDDRTSPKHFDPGVLEIFKDCRKQFASIYEKFKE